MKIISVFILISFLVCTHFVWGEDSHSHVTTGTVERFSVERTIDRARNIPSGEWWGKLSDTFNSAQCPLNPEALPEMYRILEDTNQQGDWNGMVSYIALLGGDEDVDKLEGIMKRYMNKELNDSEKRLFYNIIFSVSAMERRGIPKASKLIDKMMQPEYWQKLNIVIPKGKSGALTFGIIAIGAKSNNADPDYKKKVESILESIQDTTLKQAYSDNFTVDMQNHDAIMEARRTGDWTTYYGKPKSTPPPSLKVQRNHPDFAYEELYTSKTLWTVPAPLEKEAEKVLCKEALDAFNSALQAMIKGDMNYLVTNTAVEGRPLLLRAEVEPANIQKIFDPQLKMQEKWKSLVPIAQVFKDKALSPTQHFVQLQAGFGINQATGGSLEAPPFINLRKQPKLFYPFLLIRFRYDDLKDVAKKYPEVFNNKGRIPSVSETGEPYVVMIWEGDQWYWNPFGM